MSGLIEFWKIILIGSFVLFVPFLLVLTVLGARDLKKMLTELAADGESNDDAQ